MAIRSPVAEKPDRAARARPLIDREQDVLGQRHPSIVPVAGMLTSPEPRSQGMNGQAYAARPNPGARVRARDGVRRYGRRRDPAVAGNAGRHARRLAPHPGLLDRGGRLRVARRGVGRGAGRDVAAGRRLLRLCAPRLRQRRGIRGRLDRLDQRCRDPRLRVDHGDDVPRRTVALRRAIGTPRRRAHPRRVHRAALGGSFHG